MLARVVLVRAAMSEGMNQVNLVGNLGADPEVRQTPGGPVLKLSLATNYVYFDKENQKKTITEWHRVALFGNRAEGLKKILGKGSLIAVVGRLRTSSYEKDGQKRYSTEVIAENLLVLSSRTEPNEATFSNGASLPLRAQPTAESFL